MDKRTLSDYTDLCELIKEMEKEIKDRKKTEVVHDKVSGSNQEFPYQKRGFHVSGIKETAIESDGIKRKMYALKKKKRRAEELKEEIDGWMDGMPARMQRIVRMRYFEKKTWDEVAMQFGMTVTADSVRMEFERFMKKENFEKK